MESKILELVVYSLSIVSVIVNIIVSIKVLQRNIFLTKFTKEFEKEMKDLTKAIDRNEEKLFKIKRILEIKEDL